MPGVACIHCGIFSFSSPRLSRRGAGYCRPAAGDGGGQAKHRSAQPKGKQQPNQSGVKDNVAVEMHIYSNCHKWSEIKPSQNQIAFRLCPSPFLLLSKNNMHCSIFIFTAFQYWSIRLDRTLSEDKMCACSILIKGIKRSRCHFQCIPKKYPQTFSFFELCPLTSQQTLHIVSTIRQKLHSEK